MLIKFRVKNYKSFKDEAILDLRALPLSENKDSLLELANEKFLSSCAIYGANASGKSNIIEAFENMKRYVVYSFIFGGDSGREFYRRTPVKPFAFDKKSYLDKTLFEVDYIINSDEKEKTFRYGFTIKNEEIIEEWYAYKYKTSEKFNVIFHREKDKFDFPGISVSEQNIIISSLNKETLVVSLGAKLKIRIFEDLIR